MISALLAPNQNIVVPKLNPEKCLIRMEEVSEIFLRWAGYKPYYTTSEAEAKSEIKDLQLNGLWPVLTTPLDTAGEKPYEEFVAEGETVDDVGWRSIEYVKHIESEGLEQLLGSLQKYVLDESCSVTVDNIAGLVSDYLPTFIHHSSENKLDARM